MFPHRQPVAIYVGASKTAGIVLVRLEELARVTQVTALELSADTGPAGYPYVGLSLDLLRPLRRELGSLRRNSLTPVT